MISEETMQWSLNFFPELFHSSERGFFPPFIYSSVPKGQFYFPKAWVTPRRALPHNWKRWSPASWSLSRTLPTGGSWPPPKACLVSARKRQKGRKSSTVRKTGGPNTQLGGYTNSQAFYHASCFLSTLRAVCNWARPRADAERPSGDLLQAAGERTAPDHHRAVHYFPQPGWNHWNALWVSRAQSQTGSLYPLPFYLNAPPPPPQ